MDRKPPLTAKRILEWADHHYERTGRWPISRSGPVLAANDGTTWEAVNTALTKGVRGLPGGDSLARLLRRRRKIADVRMTWPDLSRDKILAWADDHYERTGTWPRRESGRVRCARGITWATVHRHLKKGNRSLPGGSSLVELLSQARGVRHGKSALTEARILRWAQDHFLETGRWPVTLSGKVRHLPHEDWAAIDMALRHRRRGLTRKISLSRLLAEHHGARYRATLGRITITQILEWARRHHRRTGTWPTHHAGPVYGVPDLSWAAIDYALRQGRRGLPGGMSLGQVLSRLPQAERARRPKKRGGRGRHPSAG
jgi:hypothetical protein